MQVLCLVAFLCLDQHASLHGCVLSKMFPMYVAGGWREGVFFCKVWSSGHENGPQPKTNSKEPGE